MDPQWFGDTRKVRTAVVGSAQSQEPVYLPEDPRGCEQVKRNRGKHSFYCGRTLGGCGGQLTARTCYDRVCHFAHRRNSDAQRCRRPALGDNGADHLFIGKALTKWLRVQKVSHRPVEYELDDRGRAEAVVIRLSETRVIHVQLRDFPVGRWQQRRAAILNEDPSSIILCAREGSLFQREIRSSGKALLIWCVTQQDTRKVLTDLFTEGGTAEPRDLSRFRFDQEHGIVAKAATPSPLQLAGRAAAPEDQACTRYRADGERCNRLTDAPDRWCRSDDCGGFRTAEPAAETKGRSFKTPAGGEPGHRLEPLETVFERLVISSTATGSFVAKHHGAAKEAAAELHSMYRSVLDEGTHYRLPDGTWVLDLQGYRLTVNEKGDTIIGYDTMHAERSYAQFQAGVPSRLGRQARAQRRSLRTPMSGGDFPDRLDHNAVLQLDAAQFAVTAGACQAFEKLTPGAESQSDHEFIDGLYTALNTDLRAGEIYSEGERLILHGDDAWWVLATDEPAVMAVHSPGTRALEVRPEAEVVEDIVEEPSSTEPRRLTQAEFEAIVSDRILGEREDDLHEEIRYRLMADLKKRARFSGGTAKDDTYVDAWYRAADGESVVFEVLETGGYDYEHFRKSAVDLMEVSYLHTAGAGARMVLVSAEPPSEEWIPNTLLNVFGILAAWEDGTGWAGPGREFIVTD